MNLELFASITKYPFVHNNEYINSKELAQNKTCIEKCKKKDCLVFYENKSENALEYLCSKGYNNISITFPDFKCFINGVIFENNSIVPKGRKEARLDWIIKKSSLNGFIEKLLDIERHIEKIVLETTEKNFSMFHDFKTSMTIFFNCTQDIINKLPGNSFLEKLENSDKSYRDLYNSLELITSQLGMIDVILNPNRIEFGNKKRINLYQLFEKIKILFSHLSEKKQDISIKLISENWVDDCYCYDSIEFIPLILLDNALKYSVKDSEIEIKFEQRHDTLKVIVKNIGPLVLDGNEKKIFEKFFRDDFAKTFSKEGIGMGLWIAQQILLKHDSELIYYKDRKETRPIGLNIFEFDIKIIR
jgi:K+-sensing histidine kinase KdpD